MYTADAVIVYVAQSQVTLSPDSRSISHATGISFDKFSYRIQSLCSFLWLTVR